MLTQWVLRNLAHARGLRCSFEPILMPGHAGSGMHFHFSPTHDGVHLGEVKDNGT
jgi:glutamine synthetase